MWCDGLSQGEWFETTTDSNRVFLHGMCNEWVADNYQAGDRALVIIALDEYFEPKQLMHCCLIRNGVYVDVRGETDSFDDLLESFEDWYDEEYTNIVDCESLDDFYTVLRNMGVYTNEA